MMNKNIKNIYHHMGINLLIMQCLLRQHVNCCQISKSDITVVYRRSRSAKQSLSTLPPPYLRQEMSDTYKFTISEGVSKTSALPMRGDHSVRKRCYYDTRM